MLLEDHAVPEIPVLGYLRSITPKRFWWGRVGRRRGFRLEEKSSCDKTRLRGFLPLLSPWSEIGLECFQENSDFQCISQRPTSSDSKCQAWIQGIGFFFLMINLCVCWIKLAIQRNTGNSTGLIPKSHLFICSLRDPRQFCGLSWPLVFPSTYLPWIPEN